MGATKFVIVNADDFGFSSGINRGIVEAHERGVVTSTSLMVDQPAAGEGAAYAREHPGLGSACTSSSPDRRRSSGLCIAL